MARSVADTERRAGDSCAGARFGRAGIGDFREVGCAGTATRQMNRFTDKVVIVTGAGSGIGLAAAHAFARESATVVIADRDPAAAQRAAESARDCGARDTLGIACDVADEQAVAACVDAVL